MKKLLVLFIVLVICCGFIAASLTTGQNDTLKLTLNFTGNEEGNNYKQSIVFTDNVPENLKDYSTSLTGVETLELKTSSSGEKIIGSGKTNIVWQIFRPEKFTVSLYSSALAVSGDADKTIDWTTTFTPLKQKDDKSGLEADGEKVTFGLVSADSKNYGSEQDPIKVFSHDGQSNAMKNYGSIALNITTEDISTKSAGEYATTLYLVVTADAATSSEG